jgi:5-methyltetrahydrofolate--homocysteine methyltransferase
MSGLLVKSTLIMKENLAVLNERNILPPVILGGAALTRRYVEQDLRSIYKGSVSYANDAFDGLRFMEEVLKGASVPVNGPSPGDGASGGNGAGGSGVTLDAVDDDAPALSGLEAKIALAPRVAFTPQRGEVAAPERVAVRPAAVPVAPFYGTKVVRNIPLGDIFPYVNETALIRGQWQVRRGNLTEAEYERILSSHVLPDLVRLKKEAEEREFLRPAVVYGFFPCQSEGDDLIIYKPAGSADGVGLWDRVPAVAGLEEWERFTFPRQTKGRQFCIADFFSPKSSGVADVVAFDVVTMGSHASEYARGLYAANKYKEYLYVHGLSVETAEALAEYFHKLIRRELGIEGDDAPEIRKLFSQHYRGSRYSFGYPACPALEDQARLFRLLRPERIGVSLTEEFQLVPEQSTTAIIVHHPGAKYFNV